MDEVVRRWVETFIRFEIIDPKDREIYDYGLKQGIIILFNILTLVVIGMMTDTVIGLFVFLAGYVPLRSYAGGYHARTQLKCYFFSTLIVVVVALVGSYGLLMMGSVSYILLALSLIAIIGWAPLEDKNKPIDSLEFKVYRRRMMYILVAEGICIIAFQFHKFESAAMYMLMSLVAAALMVVIGKIIDRLRGQMFFQ